MLKLNFNIIILKIQNIDNQIYKNKKHYLTIVYNQQNKIKNKNTILNLQHYN